MKELTEVRLKKPVKHNGVWYSEGQTLKMERKSVLHLMLVQAIEVVNAEEQIETEEIAVEVDKTEDIIEAISLIPNVSDEVAKELFNAGYENHIDIYNADPEELRKIKGIGKKLAKKIIDSAESLITEEEEVD